MSELRRPGSGGVVTSVRPSARVLMLVRFDRQTRDDHVAIFSPNNPDPAVVEKARARFKRRAKTAQTGPRPLPLSPVEQTAAALALARHRADVFSDRVDLATLAREVGSVDESSVFVDAQVRSLARVDGGYRAANTLELRLPWKSLPLDARAIRAILIFSYEGIVSPEAFASGFPGTSVDPSSRGGYLVPATRENLRFVGMADEVQDDHDDSGDAVTIKARDLRALLIDNVVPRGFLNAIRSGQSIIHAGRAILDSHPVGVLFRGPALQKGSEVLDFNAGDAPRTWIPPSFARSQAQGTATGAAGAGAAQPTSKVDGETLWDTLTDLAVYNGLHVRVERDVLVFFEPRTLFKSSPTDIDTGEEIPVRRLVYGSDLTKMTFARKFGKVRAPVVVVKSSNPDAPVASKRLLEAQWPSRKTQLDAERAVRGAASGAVVATNLDALGAIATQAEHVVTVRGVTSEKMLLQIAKATYESMGHQEMLASVATRDLWSYSEEPGERKPDLLSLKSGDPIQVIVAARRSGGDLGAFHMADVNAMAQSAGAGDPVERLADLGVDRKLAEKLVKMLAGYRLPKEFRVNKATFTYDADDGYTIAIDAGEYVRVRADPDDSSWRAPK